MVDLKRIFRQATATYSQSGSFAGVGSTGQWANVFKQMRDRLVAAGATIEEQSLFRDAILRAIESAPDSDLNEQEREALRHLLLTAFDGITRMYGAQLAPKAQFLQYVNFD